MTDTPRTDKLRKRKYANVRRALAGALDAHEALERELAAKERMLYRYRTRVYELLVAEHVCGLQGFGRGQGWENDECPACRANGEAARRKS